MSIELPGTNFARRVFQAAGIYGIVALLPQYFMEARIARDFPPAITHPEHFYGFVGIALAWQFVFLIIAKEPSRYRWIMLPAVLEKLAFGVPAVVLYLQGRLSPPFLVIFGFIDLMLAILFTISYRVTAGRNVEC